MRRMSLTRTIELDYAVLSHPSPSQVMEGMLVQLDDVCSKRSRPTQKYSNEKRSKISQTVSQAHDLEQQEHLQEASILRNNNHQ